MVMLWRSPPPSVWRRKLPVVLIGNVGLIGPSLCR
jgi:hypothetical protein